MSRMDTLRLKIEDIYVPVKLKNDLDPRKVEELAESILENGQETPISVRDDGKRMVLVAGLHRLEACKALGEELVDGIMVGARRF